MKFFIFSLFVQSAAFALTPDPSITSSIQSVEAARIQKDVEWLANFPSRALGTQGNVDAVNGLITRFRDLGYEAGTECNNQNVCNVVANRKSTAVPASEKIILVMAHLDSVGHPNAGADDNASGVAAMLEMARVLSTQPTKKNIQFVATNGEEDDLLGGTYHAEEMSRTGDIKKIDLAINMDMVGYNFNQTVELETNEEFKNLANWFATLTEVYTSLKSKITLYAWGSDHVPFLQRGVPTLLTIELWSTKTPCYHQACDLPKTVNYAYAAEITKLNIAAVLTNDQQ